MSMRRQARSTRSAPSWAPLSRALLAGPALLAVALAGCVDVRDFEGTWTGPRVGDRAELKQGFADDLNATLVIDAADLRSIQARLTVPGSIDDAAIQPIAGAEADVLSTMTFDGAPARVYLAFAQTTDGGGDAMAVIALYDGRVEVRVLRGSPTPLYGIFALERQR
jgi:hypothetical protein